MENKENLKKMIQEAFTIKVKNGEESKKIYENLSNQFYNFIVKTPGFTNANISRGIREIVTEKNREKIILALAELYFDYIRSNPNPDNTYDQDIKYKLITSRNEKRIIKYILNDENKIKRMRSSSCGGFVKRFNKRNE